MVQSIVRGVTSVTSAVNDAQRTDFEEFDLEFQLGSRWITQALESCKRHIVSSNGIEEESRKRRKAGSISKYKSAVSVDKENNHPNIDESGGHSDSKQVESSVMSTQSVAQNTEKEDIDIMSLKVVELRKCLGDRGLDTTGLKKVLQNRLKEAIRAKSHLSCVKGKDMNVAQEVAKEIEIIEEVIDEHMEEELEEVNKEEEEEDVIFEVDGLNSDSHNGADVPMIDSNEPATEEHIDMKTGSDEDIEMIDAKDEQYEPAQKNEHPPTNDAESHTKEIPNKKTFGAKILSPIRKVFSPNKMKNSPKKSKSSNGKSSNHEDGRVDDIGQANVSNASCDEQIGSHQQLPSKSKRASMVCNMTLDEIKSAAMKNEASGSNERSENKQIATAQPTPGFSQKKTNTTTSSSQKLRSMKEARKARLDEIRNKVHSKTMSQLNSSKKQINTAKVTKDKQHKGTDAADRKRELANQMRQKAAAEAAKQHGQSDIKAVQVVQKTQTMNKPASPPPPQQIQQPAIPYNEGKEQMSPMETYEMSDRGESDSDDSDYDDRAPKKKIPKWAQRENLRPALERQFLDGPHKLDPDDIFPEVSTCDLEAIFDQKKKRYMKRTSSGNWTKDKVTINEKLVYKRNMGFCK